MATSLAAFLVCYPEFAKAGDAMVSAQLLHAEAQVSDGFGNQRDAAVYLRLADNLALSPFGRDAKLVSPTARTSTYGARFDRMAEANGVSAARLGAGPGSVNPGYYAGYYWGVPYGWIGDE